MYCKNCTSFVPPRYTYEICTKEGKANGQPLKAYDYMELGYMAGRFGINPKVDVYENSAMKKTDEGFMIKINPYAAPLVEKKLEKEGIKFDRIG